MNDSQLDQLLKTSGSCQTPHGFSSDVWNRIAAEPDSAGLLPAWKWLIAEIFTKLSQPAGAFAACVVFVIAGSIAGLEARQETQAPEVQYIQSVSPFIHQFGK
jgi:hypothetical protein